MSNDTPLVIRENIPAKTHSFVAAAHEPTPPVPTFPYPPHLIPYPGPSPGPYGYPPFFNLPFMLGGGAIDKKPNGEKAPEENSVEEPGDLDRQHVGDFTDDASNETTLNPCVDIKSGLISALELRNSTNVSGTFAFSKTVEDAPVPGLRIKNLGSLPVPLTTKSAQELINVCELAPFGRGEKTVVDRTVRDTWELSADKVAFDNPRWDIWFQSTVVPEITQRLGIPCAATWELYKLLVYEKGSHFLAHQDTEKSDGMFATVVIVLPTIFEGGQLHMSHSNQAKIFDVSENSAFGTSFMAWYTDVRHEVKPITSGYRLALSYNLVAPIGVARPALSDCSRSVEAVRKVLLTWKDNFSPSTPNKLAYLLDHKYSSVGLKNRILKGSDVQKVDILHTLAKEHGFEVYLAKVELKVVGEAACQRKYHDMGEIISVDLKFEEIVNLDGERVELKSSAMKFDHPCDFIPHALDQGPPDEEENEGYMGNVRSPLSPTICQNVHCLPLTKKAAGHVEYWYKQTAILIWPRNRREAVFGVDWLKDAAGQLKGLASTSPSEAEKKLIEDMLFRLERGAISDEASRAICTAAVRWRDRDLWLHAAHIGEVEVRMSVLSHEDLIEAAHAFGFEKLIRLASILAKSTSNAYCLKLIAKISDSDLSCNEAGRGWCDSQREIALQNLHVPTIDDVNPLLEVIITYGIQIAQKTIIPQLLALQCAQDFWFSFLKAIYSHRQTIAPSAQATHDATKTTLRTLLEKTNPLQVKRPAHLFDKSCDYDAQVIIDLLAVSFELGSPELCDIVLQKLNDEVNGAKNASEGAPILNLYRPILKSIDNFSKIHSVNLNTPPMTVVLEMVTTRVIDHDMEREKPDWQAAIEAAKMCGNKGVCILESRLLPHLEHAKSSSGIYSQVAKTLKDTWPVDSTTEHPVLLTTLITKLVTLAISKAEILFRPSPTNLSHPDYVKTATRLLRLCLKTNNAHLALSLLSRLKSPETHFQTHFLKVAIPFITSLCHELTPRNIPVASEPYSTFCRETLIIFVDKILGHRPVYNALMPRDVFESVDCGCQTCKQMVNQLVLPDTTVTMRRNAYDRKHMEQRIISKLGLVFRTVQGSSPYGLMITKPTWLTAIGIWNERRQIGYNALVAINSTQSLDAILGEDFPKILGILEVELPRASSAESGMPMPEGVTSSSISSAFSSYPQATFPQILAQSQPHQGTSSRSSAPNQVPKRSRVGAPEPKEVSTKRGRLDFNLC